MQPIFFSTPDEFRAWLEENHDKAQEVWVGFYKKHSGKPSMTWAQAVDQALCFGWIDSRGKNIDKESHMLRFTPRKPRSTWSAVNIKRVPELVEMGLMRPAGLKAYEARTEERSGIYSHEQKGTVEFDSAYEEQFRANAPAWAFFQTQAPSYQKAAIWWVITAKKEETRLKRLNQLIEDSAQGRRVPPLSRPPRAK